MSSLFEEVEAESSHKRKNQLDVIVESLNDNDRKDFLTLLDDKTVSATALTRVMQKRGFSLNRHAITDYRNGSFRYTIERDDNESA